MGSHHTKTRVCGTRCPLLVVEEYASLDRKRNIPPLEIAARLDVVSTYLDHGQGLAFFFFCDLFGFLNFFFFVQRSCYMLKSENYFLTSYIRTKMSKRHIHRSGFFT